MVVLQSKTGQLGNRLWQASYFIANAIEHEYELVHLGFDKYYNFFSENIELNLNSKDYQCKICSNAQLSVKQRIFLKYGRLSNKICRRIHHQLPYFSMIELETLDIKYDLSSEKFTRLAKNSIVFANGWPFVDYSALRKHASLIRSVFKPNEGYMVNIQKIRNSEFCKYDKVIGVHVRRGDYAGFLNGRWFYDFSDYSRFMKEVATLPQFRNLRLGYLICSNEEINKCEFDDFDLIGSPGQFLEDLYLLSFCDLIIGPPSSYSCWAAFYGGAPLIFANTQDAAINECEEYYVGESFPY